jgi:hypothetical protein
MLATTEVFTRSIEVIVWSWTMTRVDEPIANIVINIDKQLQNIELVADRFESVHLSLTFSLNVDSTTCFTSVFSLAEFRAVWLKSPAAFIHQYTENVSLAAEAIGCDFDLWMYSPTYQSALTCFIVIVIGGADELFPAAQSGVISSVEAEDKSGKTARSSAPDPL